MGNPARRGGRERHPARSLEGTLAALAPAGRGTVGYSEAGEGERGALLEGGGNGSTVGGRAVGRGQTHQTGSSEGGHEGGIRGGRGANQTGSSEGGHEDGEATSYESYIGGQGSADTSYEADASAVSLSREW
eukprot:1790363-Pyramimonas_sp.AAC.1